LWSAAVTLNGGKAVHYSCDVDKRFLPDVDHMESLINSRTRAIVVINPNNPSGAVYDRETLRGIAALASKHGLVLMSDEIYDQMVYDEAEFIPMATLADDTVCLSFSGLSKIYRACGYRVAGYISRGKL
jgi:alanine-synthesizing transaminase